MWVAFLFGITILIVGLLVGIGLAALLLLLIITPENRITGI
ncbi:MAG TPA: hypothetical protein VGY99_11650 [Candidatus Binataceae bacterium]|jgi:hypothetical protein|nr:hypothetical protein [Candidatus Binataceae bacterium]